MAQWRDPAPYPSRFLPASDEGKFLGGRELRPPNCAPLRTLNRPQVRDTVHYRLMLRTRRLTEAEFAAEDLTLGVDDLEVAETVSRVPKRWRR